MIRKILAASMIVAAAATISGSITHASSGNIWGDKAPFTRAACSFVDFYGSSLLLANPESKYFYHFSIINESSQGFFSKEYQYLMKVMRIRNSDRQSSEIVIAAAFKDNSESKYLLISSESLPMPSLDRVVMFERDNSDADVWYIRTAEGETTNYRCSAS